MLKVVTKTGENYFSAYFFLIVIDNTNNTNRKSNKL